MPRTNISSQFDAQTIKATGARIVKRNTFERTENGETIIRLHGTDIVRKHKDGSITLNSAGWKTVTTKDRMNDHMQSGYYLYSDKGQWYVSVGHRWADSATVAVPYFDGMVIPRDVKASKVEGARQAVKEEALRKQIRKFVCDVPLEGPFPEPSSGDCWFCMMKTQEGKSLGDSTGDKSHILEHIEERYLHGSLIVNALEWAGYRRPQAIYRMKLGNLIRRALKRYLYRQCGLVA